MTSTFPECIKCKNYEGGLKCKAFPDGIPQPILEGDVNHYEPYKGDHGIQFEAA